jgi:hypothetical protein
MVSGLSYIERSKGNLYKTAAVAASPFLVLSQRTSACFETNISRRDLNAFHLYHPASLG